MSIESRKGFALAIASLAILALLTAAVVVFGGPARQGEAHSGTAEFVGGVKAVPSPNNKKSDDVGVCAYSEAGNKHHFKKVPKPKKEGKDAKSSALLKELEKGGQVADSPGDCKKLNEILADPPKGHEGEGGKAAPEDGPTVDAPPEAVEGEEVFGTAGPGGSGPQAAGR